MDMAKIIVKVIVKKIIRFIILSISFYKLPD